MKKVFALSLVVFLLAAVGPAAYACTPTPGPWETFQNAFAAGTYDGSGSSPSGYDYDDCRTDTTCDGLATSCNTSHDITSSFCNQAGVCYSSLIGVPTYMRDDGQGIGIFIAVQNGPPISFNTAANTYCSKRRLKDINSCGNTTPPPATCADQCVGLSNVGNPWESYTAAYAAGTYDGVNNPNAANYNYSQCSSLDCASTSGAACIASNDVNSQPCQQAVTCYNALYTGNTTNGGTTVAMNGSGIYFNFPTPRAFDNSTTQNGITTNSFCINRQLKGGSGVAISPLQTCLDNCEAKVVAKTSMQNCTYSSNYCPPGFFGCPPATAATSACANVNVPTNLDYTPASYPTPSTQTVKRQILVDQANADATITGDTPQAFRDYGGETPLLDAVNNALKEPSVASDMSAGKNVAFVVMTDGVDTISTNGTITSLCGVTDSLVKALAGDANAIPYVIGFNNTSSALAECANVLPSNQNVKSQDFSNTTLSDIIGGSTGSGGATDYSTQQGATDFCNNNFGARTVYTDSNVAQQSGGSGGGNPAICRAYEVDP